MVLCSKVEMALRGYLQVELAGGALIVNEAGSILVTETGIQISLGNGEFFDIPFLVGERETDIEPPCVIVVCPSGDEDHVGSGNFICEATIDVRMPGYSWTGKPDVIAALQALSKAVGDLLQAEDMASRLSTQVEEFTCQAVLAKSGGRAMEGTVRVHRFTVSLYCCETDL
jgi:hypothetical protein